MLVPVPYIPQTVTGYAEPAFVPTARLNETSLPRAYVVVLFCIAARSAFGA